MIHWGQFRIVYIDADRMDWVDSIGGRPPAGHQPVDTGGKNSPRSGGKDLKLYHAITWHDGTWLPGKAGAHLGGGEFCYDDKGVRNAQCKIL